MKLPANIPAEVYHPQKLRRKLLNWYQRHRRDLPWRRTRDPYRVWLAEVMLQQTRVAAVEPYYQRFLQLFPSVEALARARPQTVLRAWAGLGYYARARALQAAARQIRTRGCFPSTYPEWRSLPGVGPYTAAAVASIAFGQPHAVVDGNVRRVLARLFTCDEELEKKAAALLDRTRPGDFNQALMELGATVCRPRAPLCPKCPLAGHCQAQQTGAVARFPAPRLGRPLQQFRLKLALVECDGRVLLAPPSGRGWWPRFWSLPELPHPLLDQLGRVSSFRHAVTYRNIQVQVFRAQLKRIKRQRITRQPAASATGSLRLMDRAELRRLPLSTPSRKALVLAAANRSFVAT